MTWKLSNAHQYQLVELQVQLQYAAKNYAQGLRHIEKTLENMLDDFQNNQVQKYDAAVGAANTLVRTVLAEIKALPATPTLAGVENEWDYAQIDYIGEPLSRDNKLEYYNDLDLELDWKRLEDLPLWED